VHILETTSITSCVLRELQITTHDIRLVQELFLRTIVMDEGRGVADGLTIEILETEELLTAHKTIPDNSAT